MEEKPEDHMEMAEPLGESQEHSNLYWWLIMFLVLAVIYLGAGLHTTDSNEYVVKLDNVTGTTVVVDTSSWYWTPVWPVLSKVFVFRTGTAFDEDAVHLRCGDGVLALVKMKFSYAVDPKTMASIVQIYQTDTVGTAIREAIHRRMEEWAAIAMALVPSADKLTPKLFRENFAFAEFPMGVRVHLNDVQFVLPESVKAQAIKKKK